MYKELRRKEKAERKKSERGEDRERNEGEKVDLRQALVSRKQRRSHLERISLFIK